MERALSVRANPETVSGEFRAQTWLRAGSYGYNCVTVAVADLGGISGCHGTPLSVQAMYRHCS